MVLAVVTEQWMETSTRTVVVYKEEETKTEHAIGLYPRKTIYLDILTMHTQLHAKYVTYCLLF